MSDTVSAALDEFAVLYTSQVVQKSKCWNEGFLKFHTFNRRAMLYDEERSLLDDTFLGKSSLKVGDQIRFDRHLVTIEAKICHTIRDLTPLYERKGRNVTKTTPPIPHPPNNSMATAGSPISRLRKRPILSTHCTAGSGLRRPALAKSVAGPDSSNSSPATSRASRVLVARPGHGNSKRTAQNASASKQSAAFSEDEDAIFGEIIERMSDDDTQEMKRVSNNVNSIDSTSRSKGKCPRILENTVNVNAKKSIGTSGKNQEGKNMNNKAKKPKLDTAATVDASVSDREVLVIDDAQQEANRDDANPRVPLGLRDGNASGGKIKSLGLQDKGAPVKKSSNSYSPHQDGFTPSKSTITTGTVPRRPVPSIQLNRSLLKLPKINGRPGRRGGPLMQSYCPASRIVQERHNDHETKASGRLHRPENKTKDPPATLLRYDNVYEDEDLNDMDFGDLLATQQKSTIESSCSILSSEVVNDNNNNCSSNSGGGAFDEDDSHVLYRV